MGAADRSSEVPHLADETHGDLPPLAGHLHLCAVDRGPLEALVVAPKQARGAAPSGILAIPWGGRGDVCLGVRRTMSMIQLWNRVYGKYVICSTQGYSI